MDNFFFFLYLGTRIWLYVCHGLVYIIRCFVLSNVKTISLIKILVQHDLIVRFKTKINSEIEFNKKALCHNDCSLGLLQIRIHAKIAPLP